MKLGQSFCQAGDAQPIHIMNDGYDEPIVQSEATPILMRFFTMMRSSCHVAVDEGKLLNSFHHCLDEKGHESK